MDYIYFVLFAAWHDMIYDRCSTVFHALFTSWAAKNNITPTTYSDVASKLTLESEQLCRSILGRSPHWKKRLWFWSLVMNTSGDQYARAQHVSGIGQLNARISHHVLFLKDQININQLYILHSQRDLKLRNWLHRRPQTPLWDIFGFSPEVPVQHCSREWSNDFQFWPMYLLGAVLDKSPDVYGCTRSCRDFWRMVPANPHGLANR